MKRQVSFGEGWQMINNTVYNPYLQKNIEVKALDTETLELYIRISKKMQAKCPSDCEVWHTLQALIDAYEETVDLLNRGEL